MNFKLLSWAPVWALLFLVAARCDAPKNDRSMKKGAVHIAIDESFQPVMESEIAGFTRQYAGVQLTPHFVDEGEAFKLFWDDSCKVIMAPRDLTPEEVERFKAKRQFSPHTALVASDGIIVVLNKANPDSNLTMAQLKDILTGKLATWSELRKAKGKDSITVVLDQNNSSLYRHLQDTVLAGQPLGNRVFASTSNPNVLKYVSENKNAIGFIGYNWINNAEDERVKDFLPNIQMAGLTDKENPEPKDFIRLNNESIIYYLKHRRYPLQRLVYLINGDTPNSPGSGFMHYMLGQDGQLILYRANLVPKRLPMREVELKPTDKEKFLKGENAN